MQINFFSGFKKRNNSTKVPLLSNATRTLTGYLKEPCSIMHPVFNIERPQSDAAPYSYTYAYIGEFARYYFVKDWTWNNGVWECDLVEDVLASYKTEIGNLSEYVLRTDSTTVFNGEITDTTYPATTDIEVESYALNNVFATDLTVGCYIVGIISGGSADAVGAITYYAMSSTEFGALKQKLFSNDNLEIMGIIDSQGQQLVQDLSQEVLKTLYNPYQYIASCMWFPVAKSFITGSTAVTSIKIGWWDYPLAGNRMYIQTGELGNEQITVHSHPQAARGSYLNYAPYTRRSLVGRFGSVPLDTTMFKAGETINISYMIDFITGQCYAKISRRYTISSTTYEDLIAERNFQLGIQIQIAQVGTDYLGTAINAVNTVNSVFNGAVSGAATGSVFGGLGAVGGAIGGAISNGLNGIYNTLQSAMPQVETGGQNGCFLAPSNVTHLVEQFYKIVDEDIGHRGRPLCEIKTLSTLSGFILCAEGDTEISCFDNERQAIATFLTTGFFWE